MTPQTEDIDGKFGMNLSFSAPATQRLGDGFNEYGVRENDDGSIDVRFQAMEPGIRKGYEITPEFLRNTTAKDYDRIPLQLDHSESQRANVGHIKPETLGFDDRMQVGAHVPNTGSSVRDDIIADFSHEPPQVTDISVSFKPESVEVEVPDAEGAAPRFIDAEIREFSLTPFPAGYENGGLTPAFSEAIEDTVSERQTSDATSSLVERPHLLITK